MHNVNTQRSGVLFVKNREDRVKNKLIVKFFIWLLLKIIKWKQSFNKFPERLE